MSLLQPSKRTVQVLTYIGVFLCASMLVVGTLAAIFENAAIVQAEMVRSCSEIPEKALKGYIQGENYIVPLN